jgi:hypothetical protein
MYSYVNTELVLYSSLAAFIGEAVGGIPFNFWHPSVIYQSMEHSQDLKLCSGR